MSKGFIYLYTVFPFSICVLLKHKQELVDMED